MLKIAVFWLVAPCILVDIYRRFRGICCIHNQRYESWEHDDGGSKYLWTSANFYKTTQHYNPEDSHLHTQQLKSSCTEETAIT
jgi:hypothetical protein